MTADMHATSFESRYGSLPWRDSESGHHRNEKGVGSSLSYGSPSVSSAYHSSNASPMARSQQHHHHHPASVRSPPPGSALSHMGSPRRTYGLDADLRPLPGRPPAAPIPAFSVEIEASSFDHRGRPVLLGRAAEVKGTIRMPAGMSSAVVLKLGAYTDQGTSPAVWEGVALAPQNTGEQRRVFEIKDRLQPDYRNVTKRQKYTRDEPDSFIVNLPFCANLPVGCSTRFVDGIPQAVPVALPPSFEISSKGDGYSKKGIMDKVYEMGCHYRMTFTLERSKSGKSKANGDLAAADTIQIPFVFLGEPTALPPPPPCLPDLPSPDLLFRPGKGLGPGWDVHSSVAKWSGMSWKVARRTIALDLHLPASGTLHAPSVVPFMLILRPSDPTILPPKTDPTQWQTRTTQSDNTDSTSASAPSSEGRSEGSEGTHVGSLAAKSMRASLALSRLTSASTAFERRAHPRQSPMSMSDRPPRPSTAPTTASQGCCGEHSKFFDLASLIDVALIQNTYCSTSNINDRPHNLKRVLSIGYLEEVDLEDLEFTAPHADELPRLSSAESLAHARTMGVRVLLGRLNVSPSVTPGFRCQGLEVKYAIKVDIQPPPTCSGSPSLSGAFRGLGLKSRSRRPSDGLATPPPTPPSSNTSSSIFSSPIQIGGQPHPGVNGSVAGSGGSSSSPMSPSVSGYEGPASPPSSSEIMTPQSYDSGRFNPLPLTGSPSLHSIWSNLGTGTGLGSGSVGRGMAMSIGSGMGGRMGMSMGMGSASSMTDTMSVAESKAEQAALSKMGKTIGALWIDVRMVRGQASWMR